MLTRIDLSNFILFHKAILDINSNFSVITGESGSGKSMIFEAIKFCFGINKNKTIFHIANQDVSVSLAFNIKCLPSVKELLDAAAIVCAEDCLIVRRILSVNNKSKCFVNDVLVSVHFLKELLCELIEMHNQDDRSFDDTVKFALNFIDNFIGLSERSAISSLY
jgi:DNA repair protein RecN (Recombination protein N)